jgi:hypothetical protein
MISGNISSSSLTNSTFTNITPLYNLAYGGAIFISIRDYPFFAIDRCVFTQCKASDGGALYLDIPYIYITHTRFENNSGSVDGSDIFVWVTSCFNLAKNDSLDSSVCSITPLGDRLNCGGISDTSQLLNTCSKEVVLECFFFFLFFYAFYL